MTDDAVIRASADGMIRNFGADAHAAAMKRVERFRKIESPENVKAACVWLAIATAIGRSVEGRSPNFPATPTSTRDAETASV